MPLTAGLVIGGISALGKIGTGIGQLSDAKKKSKNNIRPTFDIQQEYFDNRDIAAERAQHGFGEESLDFYSDQAGRGLSTSLSSLLQGGGGINSVQGVLDTYQQGIRSVAAQDAQLQNENIRYFIDRNADVAKQKVQKWVIDKYEPFKDTAAAAAQERAAGFQNISTGLGEATATASSFATGNLYEGLLKNPAAPPAAAAGDSTSYYNGYNPNSQYADFQDPYNIMVKPPATSTSTIANRMSQSQGLSDVELQELMNMLSEAQKGKE